MTLHTEKPRHRTSVSFTKGLMLSNTSSASDTHTLSESGAWMALAA